MVAAGVPSGSGLQNGVPDCALRVEREIESAPSPPSQAGPWSDQAV